MQSMHLCVDCFSGFFLRRLVSSSQKILLDDFYSPAPNAVQCTGSVNNGNLCTVSFNKRVVLALGTNKKNGEQL